MCDIRFFNEATNKEKYCGYRAEDTMYITEHAEQRMKERIGWNKRATQERMLKKVFDLNNTKLKGKYKRYLTNKANMYADVKNREAETFYVYGKMAFVCNNQTLITVINLYKLDGILEKGKNRYSQKKYKREHNYNIDAYACD